MIDCSCAGYLLNHLMDMNTDAMEDETRDLLFLGACGRVLLYPSPLDCEEKLAISADFPADLFTACLTDPLRVSIRWYLHIRGIQPFSLTNCLQADDNIEEDFAYRLVGGNYDRNLPRGKLRMVFDCITDCMAWNVCDMETYKMLFKTDEMVAALFRNFLLAQVALIPSGQL